MDRNALMQRYWDSLQPAAPRQQYGGVLDQLGIVPPQQDTPDRNGLMDRVGQGTALLDHWTMGIPTTVAGLVNSAIPGQPLGDMWSIKDNAETARSDLARSGYGDFLALPDAFAGSVPGAIHHAPAAAQTASPAARQAGRLAESAIDPIYQAMPSNAVGSAGGRLGPHLSDNAISPKGIPSGGMPSEAMAQWFAENRLPAPRGTSREEMAREVAKHAFPGYITETNRRGTLTPDEVARFNFRKQFERHILTGEPLNLPDDATLGLKPGTLSRAVESLGRPDTPATEMPSTWYRGSSNPDILSTDNTSGLWMSSDRDYAGMYGPHVGQYQIDGKIVEIPYSDLFEILKNPEVLKRAQAEGATAARLVSHDRKNPDELVVFDRSKIRNNDQSPQSPKGITAYHGSPHDFDRFDMSKIGTGEGAQAPPLSVDEILSMLNWKPR